MVNELIWTLKRATTSAPDGTSIHIAAIVHDTGQTDIAYLYLYKLVFHNLEWWYHCLYAYKLLAMRIIITTLSLLK